MINSLRLSNLAEMITHVFLIKTANSLMWSHHLPPPNNNKKNACWVDWNHVKQIKNGALIHSSLFVTIDNTLDDIVGHSIFGTHVWNIDQTTRAQTLWTSIQLETDITITSFPGSPHCKGRKAGRGLGTTLTSLIVVTLLKLTLRPSAFSYLCKFCLVPRPPMNTPRRGVWEWE